MWYTSMLLRPHEVWPFPVPPDRAPDSPNAQGSPKGPPPQLLCDNCGCPRLKLITYPCSLGLLFGGGAGGFQFYFLALCGSVLRQEGTQRTQDIGIEPFSFLFKRPQYNRDGANLDVCLCLYHVPQAPTKLKCASMLDRSIYKCRFCPCNKSWNVAYLMQVR